MTAFGCYQTSVSSVGLQNLERFRSVKRKGQNQKGADRRNRVKKRVN